MNSKQKNVPPTPTKSLAGNGFWDKLSQVREQQNRTLQIQHSVNSGGGARGRRQEVFTFLNVKDTQFDPMLLLARKIGMIEAPLEAGRDVQEAELKSLIAKAKKGDRQIINLGHDIVFGHHQTIQQAYPLLFPDAKANRNYNPKAKKADKGTSSSKKPKTTDKPSAPKGAAPTDAPTSKKDKAMTTYDDIDLSALPKISLDDLCEEGLIHRLMDQETCIVVIDDGDNIPHVAISKPLLNEGFGTRLNYVLNFGSDAKIAAFVHRYENSDKQSCLQIGSSRPDSVAGSEIIIGPIDQVYDALSDETKRDWAQLIKETEEIIYATIDLAVAAPDNGPADTANNGANDVNNDDTNDSDTPSGDDINDNATVDLTEFAKSNPDNSISWTNFGVKTSRTVQAINQGSGFQFVTDRKGAFGVIITPKHFGTLSQDQISNAAKHSISDMTVYRKEIKAEVQDLNSIATIKQDSITSIVFPISEVPSALAKIIQQSPVFNNINDDTASGASNDDDTPPSAGNDETSFDNAISGEFSIASKTRLALPENLAEIIARKKALRTKFTEMVNQLQDTEHVAEIPVGDAQVHVSSNPMIVENIEGLAEYFEVQVQHVGVKEDTTESTPSQWQGAFERAVETGDLIVFSTPDHAPVVVSSSPDFYRRMEQDFPVTPS